MKATKLSTFFNQLFHFSFSVIKTQVLNIFGDINLSFQLSRSGGIYFNTFLHPYSVVELRIRSTKTSSFFNINPKLIS